MQLLPSPHTQFMKARESVKTKFIALKTTCRTAIGGLPQRRAEEKTKELNDLQFNFRNMDETFKAFRSETASLGVERDRRNLFSGAAERKDAGGDAIIAGNDEFLRKGKSIAQDTTAKLREAMGDLRQADEVRGSGRGHHAHQCWHSSWHSRNVPPCASTLGVCVVFVRWARPR